MQAAVQVALHLAQEIFQLAFLAAIILEDRHLRRLKAESLAEAARQPSLACLLDMEQAIAEGRL